MNSHASMNRMYRVVWNAATMVWQAVAETSAGHGKTSVRRKKSGALLAAGALALAGSAAMAGGLPTGGTVVGGQGNIATAGNAMTINQASSKLAIDWQSFSVGQGNSVNFVQPSASAIALNSVLGSDVSVIQGAINANGKVFLLNPNGVLFTPTAQVNVGGIVASTLAMSTSDFMAGNYKLTGSSSNAVVNQGNITAVDDGTQGGSIALIAAKIVNDGNLSATGGSVQMAAASDVTLDLGGPVKLTVNKGALNAQIDNGGAIQADGGTIYLTAMAVDALTSAVINNTGVIRAQTLATGEKGDIRLIADMATGTANVGGTLDASAPKGGNGGFIETSGSVVNTHSDVIIDAGATVGRGGDWLIDPYNYTIASAQATTIANALNTGTSVTVSTQTASGIAGYTAPSGSGDITVSSAITKNSGGNAALTLRADQNIIISAPITSTAGTLDLTLSAANGATNLGGVAINANLSSNGGDILIGGAGGNVSAAQVVRNGIGYALNSSASTPAITLNAVGANSVSVRSGGGNITMNGYSTQTPSGSGDGAGVHIFAGGVVDSGNYSNGAAYAPTAGGNIVISGYATSSGSNNQFGIKFDQNTGQSVYKTTVASSPVNGTIILDGNNSVNSQYALGLSNAGNQGNLYFAAYSTADFLVLVNGNPSIAQFVQTPPNSGCRVGYPNCGTFSVPGANGSYPYATFNAVVWSANNIYVTGDVAGSKVYDGLKTATGLTATNLACSSLLAGCDVSGLTTAGLWSFNTSSPNVDTYKVLTPAQRTYSSGGTNYLVGYFFLSGNYDITPAPLGITVAGNYNGTNTYSSASSTITAKGLAGTDTLTAVTIGNPNVLSNGSNYVTGLSGTTTNGTGAFLASNYTLNPGYNGTLSDSSIFDGSMPGGGVTPVASATATSSTNSVWLSSAVLTGITVHGTYNGTNLFSTSNATITADGLLTGDVIDSVTVNNANVAANGTNFVTSIATGHNGSAALTGNYVFNGSYNYTLANGATFTGSNGLPTKGDGTTPSTATNAVIIDPAPLGIALSAVYNGTSTFNLVNSGGALETRGNGDDQSTYTNSGLVGAPTTAATLSVTGLVGGDTLGGVTLNSAAASSSSAINGISGTAGGGGGVNLSNYYVYNVDGTATNNASTSGGNITTNNNTAEIAKAALGINLNAVYNGTTSYSGIIQTDGLLGSDAVSSVGINSANVVDNTTNANTGNYVKTVTGTTAGGTDLLTNYTIHASANGTPTTGAPATTDTNTVTLTPAPLGIDLAATYNGTNTFNIVNSGGVAATVGNVSAQGIYTNSGLTSAPTTTGTISVTGLVGGDTLGGVSLNSAAATSTSAINGISGAAGGDGGVNLSNYYVYNVDGTATNNASACGVSCINTDNNTAVIAKAALTVTGSTTSSTYNGAAQTNSTAFTTSGLLGSDSVTGVSGQGIGTNTGTYTDSLAGATGTGLANYTISYVNGALTITPKAITVSANAQTKVYGSADPTLSYTTSGLETGDSLSGALTRAPGETVAGGPYAINQGTLANSNYTITFSNGALTITPKAITVSANAQTKVYGSADPTLSYTTSGLETGDSLSGALTRAPGETVAGGPYAINQGTLANSNYTITFSNGALTITPRPITVKADDKAKAFSAIDPTLTYQVTSGHLVGADSLGALNRDAGEASGQYTIHARALANSNYQITAIDGTLTIGPAPVPPPSPIIVPAFVDNGSEVLASQSPTTFGGLNYVLTGGASAGGDTGASTLNFVANTSGDAGTRQGGAGNSAAGGTGAGASNATGQGNDNRPAGDAANGGNQTNQGASSLNFVASNSADGNAGQGGNGAQGNGAESGKRKSTSDLNINNVTVPSSTGPLDVFVVDTGINLERIAKFRGLTN